MTQPGDIERLAHIERPHRGMINVMPLQTGSILTDAARRVLVEFGDGYSICDYCQGRLVDIPNPPVKPFVAEMLPEFLGSEAATLTYGARDGIFMVIHAMTKPGDIIVVDGNRHYSTAVAAERAGVELVPVPNFGHPEYTVDAEAFAGLIAQHKPALVIVTYPDGRYGNLVDASRVGEIAMAAGVPYLVNGAYSVGRMPVKMSALNADFLVGSGHKSMASAGPSGVLGLKAKWVDTVLRRSHLHKNKEVECLGCTIRGVTLATLMASFPTVVERVQHWDEQVAKAQWFSAAMESIGFTQLGEKPHRHDLLVFETTPLYEISQRVRERGYYLYKEMEARGIWGIKPGQTKALELSTFAATREELAQVIQAFKDILEKYR
ncbi:MAG: O-phospho-L-seryl-tRNA:Cys-tRNA synthase [Dehalococcoidia bacterium]|nr:O-phospho-L-seryl-tRNA:Cys-tRNA synthase [Dehalococcoidia bacterium]